MKDEFLTLGIDTSNYTTSAALALGGRIISNRKLPLPVGEGQRGLRQSDAVFAHIKNLPEIMKMIGDDLSGHTVDAVGFSSSPRNIEGSYMPCFLTGSAAAYTAAAVSGAEIFAFSHQEGHIAAALYSAGKFALLDGDSPFAAFHVSGGTTDILLVAPSEGNPKKSEPLRMDIERIGGTNDLNAGQLIDRVGVMMGEKFPCGAALERSASEIAVQSKISVSVRGLECSLSGAENKARELYDRSHDKALTSAFTLDYVAVTIDSLSSVLRERFNGIPIIYAGGVMSCKRMRGLLGMRNNVYFSEPEFSADNAAGIALLAYRSLIHEK